MNDPLTKTKKPTFGQINGSDKPVELQYDPAIQALQSIVDTAADVFR